MPATRLRAYREDGHVIAEHSVPESQQVSFESEDTVAYVVFYDGPKASEVVIGRLEVGTSGKISVEFSEDE